jgi:hypothetical protein
MLVLISSTGKMKTSGLLLKLALQFELVSRFSAQVERPCGTGNEAAAGVGKAG